MKIVRKKEKVITDDYCTKKSKMTDPQGSDTGVPTDKNEKPTQDACDL